MTTKKMVEVFCTETEAAMLKRAAQRMGTTLTGFVRRAALEAADRVNLTTRKALLRKSAPKPH